MLSVVKRCGIIFLLSLVLVLPSISLAHAGEEKRILILNSYHKGFTWSDRVTDAIIAELENSSYKVNISTEYLDWKNYPTSENTNNFYQSIKYKYKNQSFDLIVTNDDAATVFALKYRDKLFPKTPIIFSGLFRDTALQVFKKNKDITGVIEDIDSQGTIEAALKLFPFAKTIYVIHEPTESGEGSLKDIENSAKAIDSSLKVRSLDNISFSDLSSFPTNLPKNSILILTNYFRDPDGKTSSAEESVSLLSQRINKPIFYVYEMGFGHGVIGGSILTPRLHGKQTAELALRVLGGEEASNIVPCQGADRVLMFDYQVLKKFNISRLALPKGSKIVNAPVSFYQKYKKLVWLNLTILTVLLLFIVVLLLNIWKRKKAEKLLQNSYDELTALYEELAATEESLRCQYQELEANKELLEKSEERYKMAFKASNEGLWDQDLVTGENYFSSRWYKDFGFNRDEPVTLNKFYRLVHPDHKEKARRVFYEIKKGKIDKYAIEIKVKDKNNQYRWILAKGIGLRNEQGELIRLAGSHQDIHFRKIQEEKIKTLAYFDKVTGLPNRVNFYEWLGNKLNQESCGMGAVFFIDLDNFKMVNDTFGHLLGDKLLKEIGEKLTYLPIKDKLVARLGGDEFIMVVNYLTGLEEVTTYAKNILNVFKNSLFLEGNELVISASIGIALYPNDGKTIDDLLKKADSAMYKAKKLGKSNFALFDEAIEEELYMKMILSSKLRTAIERGELTLFYQPQLNIVNNKIYGFEALARWFTPEYGYIPPLKFIVLAEENGQIAAIGEWVLRQTCSFAVKINQGRQEKLVVAANISAVQLMQKDFVDIVQRILEETGLDPNLLGLEITETILMESFDSNAQKLQILKSMGIKVSLDDFGTGYSSLNYLRELPINTLKIDKSFIDDIMENEKVKCLTESIIEMAHNMGFDVVAEGVETEEQLNFLSLCKCDLVQGYLISKPVPEQEAIKIMQGEKNEIG